MSVRCAGCGEELVGNVNRCWKCGSEMVSTPDSHEAPPIRRAPVELRDLPEESATGDSNILVAEIDLTEFQPVTPPRVSKTAYPKNTTRENLAISGLVTAAMSLLSCFATGWAAIPALIGLFMAIYGFSSSRKKIAIIALLLATLALGIISVRTVLSIKAYRQQQQMNQDSQL